MNDRKCLILVRNFLGDFSMFDPASFPQPSRNETIRQRQRIATAKRLCEEQGDTEFTALTSAEETEIENAVASDMAALAAMQAD